jgi:hypothetical protein
VVEFHVWQSVIGTVVVLIIVAIVYWFTRTER